MIYFFVDDDFLFYFGGVYCVGKVLVNVVVLVYFNEVVLWVGIEGIFVINIFRVEYYILLLFGIIM